MKCFVRPIFSVLNQKSFLKELVLEANSCLAKLEYVQEEEKVKVEKGNVPGRGDETCQRSVAG